MVGVHFICETKLSIIIILRHLSSFFATGTAASNPRGFLENVTSLRHNVETPPSVPNQGQTPPEHCLETLLRNIEGLLAIAAHNARQQQTQLQLQKGKLISARHTLPDWWCSVLKDLDQSTLEA